MQVTSPPSRLALPVVLLAVFVMPIGISGTAVALPRIAVELGSNPTLLQGVVNGFNAAFAIFMLVWGVLSDRIGHHVTFITGTALMLAGSVVSAIAPNLAILDLGRILCGIAGAAIFAGASATLSNAYDGAARARNFAIFGSTLGLGGTIGPTLAGWLMPVISWRGVLLAYGMVAGLALIASGHVPRLQRTATTGPAVDFSLLRNPGFMMFALVPVADAIGFMTLFTYLPVALSAIHAMGSAAAGTMLLLMTVPVFLAPMLVAWMMRRFPSIRPMQVIYASLAILLVGDLGMFLLDDAIPVAAIALPMVLLGFGWGLPAGLVDGAAIGAVPPERSGTAAGVLNFLRLGSEAVFIAGFAATVRWAIGLKLPSDLADRVAAGEHGEAAIYVAAQRAVLGGLVALTIATTAIIALCHRAASKTARAAS